jgi:hypothetical protein
LNGYNETIQLRSDCVNLPLLPIDVEVDIRPILGDPRNNRMEMLAITQLATIGAQAPLRRSEPSNTTHGRSQDLGARPKKARSEVDF